MFQGAVAENLTTTRDSPANDIRTSLPVTLASYPSFYSTWIFLPAVLGILSLCMQFRSRFQSDV